ncbi:MAG: hypothetical protein IJK04_11290 [Kiritimatiellae bacterium]|nr:hypothetical protein [Kiritimatiellia bacterium]
MSATEPKTNPKSDETVNPDPEYVWHFTTQEGLPAILLGEDGLLAGHSSFMDDLEDASYSRQAVSLIIDTLWNALTSKWPGGIERKLQLLKNRMLSGAVYPFFIACLSTKSDDYEMWKVRTGNGGFALKIRYRDFKADTEGEDVVFKECQYGKTDEATGILRKIQNALDLYRQQIINGDREAHSKEELARIVRGLHDLSMELVGHKKEKYRFENEIRLVRHFKDESSIKPGQIRFIESKPFITVPNNKGKHFRDYVDEILVSPFGDVAKSLTIASFVARILGKDPDFVREMTNVVKPLEKRR